MNNREESCAVRVKVRVKKRPTTNDVQSDKQGTTDVVKRINNSAYAKKRNKRVLIGLVIAIVIAFGISFSFWSRRDSFIAKPFSEDVDAIAAAEASVVKVYCYDHYGNETATGSGVVLFHKDMVVTNYHVIEDVYSIRISTDQDITYNVAGVWHESKQNDIAILRLERETDLIPLQIGDPSLVKKGETVTAIGSPLGIKNTVSKGNLSARVMENNYDLLQFTAPISNGSSGGALFNEKGEVIGITYASFVDGQNLNLAIPINLVEELYLSRSVSMLATPLDDTYWENHKDEYYAFTYGEPIEVTIKQLKSNPGFYDDKYIKVTAYVSSIDVFKDTLIFGFFLADAQNITKNISYDKNVNTTSDFHQHSFLRVSHRLLNIDVGEKVEVVGVFKYWEKGDESFNGVPLQYSKAYVDMVYLNGQRTKQ